MNAGPLLFARYAYPPNELGYCGPGDADGMLEAAIALEGSSSAGDVAGEITERARSFEGAWPYLQLIATANRIADPLDERVVEAYWIGNSLLDNVTPALLGGSIETRFRRRAGRGWESLIEVLPVTSRPHHSFHVFAIYPWVGLLRSGRVAEPLRVLDQCRIRWGLVEEVTGDLALVRSRPLTWDGLRLGYGPVRTETATVAKAGSGFVGGLRSGEWVSLHWDWICDRLTQRQVVALGRYSDLSLWAVNNADRPGTAAILS